MRSCRSSPTERSQFVLHLQYHSLPDVLQQADNLIVAKLWQVDAVHWLDVISYIQLVTPVESHGQTVRIKAALLTEQTPQKLQIFLCHLFSLKCKFVTRISDSSSSRDLVLLVGTFFLKPWHINTCNVRDVAHSDFLAPFCSLFWFNGSQLSLNSPVCYG